MQPSLASGPCGLWSVTLLSLGENLIPLPPACQAHPGHSVTLVTAGTMQPMGDLSRLSVEQPVDIDGLRHRLARMSDTELRRFGDASKFMCSPGANLGKPPREVFIVQLHEARAEWKRRHPA